MARKSSCLAGVVIAASLAAVWGCSTDGAAGGEGGAGGSDGSGGDTDAGGAPSGGGSHSGSTGGSGGTGENSEPTEICSDAAGTPECETFPPLCGNASDYQRALFGSAGPDNLNELSTSPLSVYFGAAGDDSLRGYGSGSCLVGGDGNDELEFGSDSLAPTSNVGIGGPGVDVWILDHPPAPPLLADVSVDEEIQFKAIGTFDATFIEFIDDFSAGDAKAATTHVVYDPNSGDIWLDQDGAGPETPELLAQVGNHAEVALTLANFTIAD